MCIRGNVKTVETPQGISVFQLMMVLSFLDNSCKLCGGLFILFLTPVDTRCNPNDDDDGEDEDDN